MSQQNQLQSKIRILRLKKGIKQTELCKATGISQSQLSKIENCHIEITEEQLNSLCRYMNVTEQELQAHNSFTTQEILSALEIIKKENSDIKIMLKDICDTLKIIVTEEQK
jgi:transcriptional regulator with XRE-family HTH domain